MKVRLRIFQDLIEEHLASISDIAFRRLFSGFGLYAGEAFFGLIHGEKLYFHTDDRSQPKYVKLGSTFFTTPRSKKSLKQYYEVPTAIIERKSELVNWALEAIETRRRNSEESRSLRSRIRRVQSTRH